MNLREFVILDAMNIATARYQRHPRDWKTKSLAERLRYRGFQATAAQVAEVLLEDERLAEIGQFTHLTSREVGETLGRMAQGYPERRAPLVEKLDTRHWRLTDAGVEALSA